MNTDLISGHLRLFSTLIALFLSTGIAPTHAADAHVHGQGNLDITIEPGQVHLLLTAPTDDLRTGDNTEKTLISRDDLFAFPDSGCALHSSKVADSTLFTDIWGKDDQDHHTEHGPGHEREQESGHSDTFLSWTYRCALSPSTIQVKLFSDTRLQKILIRAASESGVVSGEATVDVPGMSISTP